MVSMTIDAPEPPEASANTPDFDDRWCPRCLLLGPGIHIKVAPNEQFPHMLGTHEWGRLLTMGFEEAAKIYDLIEGKTHAENITDRA